MLLNLLSNNRLSKRRKARKSKIPQISSIPQRLGVGYTMARITRNVAVTAGDSLYEVMSNCFASYEYGRQATDFTFARLKNITVIQHPISAPIPQSENYNSSVFMYMDWVDGNIESVHTIDNSKLIYTNLTRPKIYTFLPPNARLRYDENSEIVAQSLPINYREWFDARSFVAKNAPGWIKFTNSSSIRFMLTVDIVMEFKGAKGLDSINKKDVDKFIKVGLPPAPEIKIGDFSEEEEKEEDDREEKNKRKNEKKREKKERIKEYEDKAKLLK